MSGRHPYTHGGDPPHEPLLTRLRATGKHDGKDLRAFVGDGAIFVRLRLGPAKSQLVATRDGGWPTEPVTEAADFVDLVWHECEFRDGYSYSYAVYERGGTYVGCCYLYPLGRRTGLSEALLDYDVDVSWWVTPTAYERGDYNRLYIALQHWLSREFPFWQPYYSNREIPAQS